MLTKQYLTKLIKEKIETSTAVFQLADKVNFDDYYMKFHFFADDLTGLLNSVEETDFSEGLKDSNVKFMRERRRVYSFLKGSLNGLLKHMITFKPENYDDPVEANNAIASREAAVLMLSFLYRLIHLYNYEEDAAYADFIEDLEDIDYLERLKADVQEETGAA